MEGHRTIQDSIRTGLGKCSAEVEQEIQSRRIIYLLFTKYRANTLFPSGFIICTVSETIFGDLESALENMRLNGGQISYIVAIDVDASWVEINDGILYFSRNAPTVPGHESNIMLNMALLHFVHSPEGVILWQREDQSIIVEP